MNLSDVNMHLLAAIFIDYKAIVSPGKSVWARRARAADSANIPPDPIPMVSSISKTFPVPSS